MRPTRNQPTMDRPDDPTAPPRLPFAKLHGLGNDYVYVDGA